MSKLNVISLGEIAKFKYGKTLKKNEILEYGLYPVFSGYQIVGYLNSHEFKEEQLIIVCRGAGGTGDVKMSPKDCSITNLSIIINVDETRFDKKYIYWVLKNSDTYSLRTGSAQPQITINSLEKFPIEVIHNIETQKRIVNILDNLDKKIQLNTQINQTLEQIAQAIFKSWFVDFDPVRAKADSLAQGKTQAEAELAAMQIISGKTPEELTALSQTHPDQYAELAEIAKAFPSEFEEVEGFGEVPRGWEVKTIDDVIQKIPVGKKYSSKTALEKGDIPILDQGRSGIIGYHNNESGVKASIEEPVIVFANHTCYMRLISYDFSAIQNIFTFKGKELNIYWTYLATLGKQEFVEYKGHFPDFLIKEIIVPNPKLTESFGKIVKENFSKIFLNDLENSYLSEIRDLLLPRLLSGEIGYGK